jgi:hypothetical protein
MRNIRWDVGLDPLAKFLVFQPRPRQHGDKAAAGPVDVIHVLARAQFGIGDIEKIWAPGHNPQRLPSLDVGSGVAGIAIGAAEGHRYIAVGGHGENQQQLLEIGAVVLRVSVSDRRRRPSANLPARRRSVASVEAHRGTVVVKLIEVNAEALADRHHDLGQ